MQKSAYAPGNMQASQSAALEEKKLPALKEALDIGIAELDSGQGIVTSPEELLSEIRSELGMSQKD